MTAQFYSRDTIENRFVLQMMATQAALIAETIAGMKRTLSGKHECRHIYSESKDVCILTDSGTSLRFRCFR